MSKNDFTLNEYMNIVFMMNYDVEGIRSGRILMLKEPWMKLMKVVQKSNLKPKTKI